VKFSIRGGDGGGWISAGETPAAPGKVPAINGGSTLASSKAGDSEGGGGWESAGDPPPALGKPPMSDGRSTLAASELGGGGLMLAALEHGSDVPMWPHSASMNMRMKCCPSRSGTQSRAREEDVALEDRLKGEGESRCNG
jgi:hypothetical protein